MVGYNILAFIYISMILVLVSASLLAVHLRSVD